MILVRKHSGGKTSFRTQRGMVHGRVVRGFIVVDVDPLKAKMMRVLYKFHPAPLGFSLDQEQPKQEEPKKPAPKKPAPKTSSKRKTSSRKK